MGAVNIAALALFVLLVPGFLATMTFYSSGSLSRFDHQAGAIYDAASLVLISSVVHFFTATLFIIFGYLVFGNDGVAKITEDIVSMTNKPSLSIEDNYHVLSVMTIYVFSILLVPMLVAYKLIKAIEAGEYRFIRRIGKRITHGAFYDLIVGRKKPLGENDLENAKVGLTQEFDYIIASIMVNIIITNRIVVYKGIVKEIVTGSKRQIESVSIEYPVRFLVKVKDDTIETQSQKDYRNIFDVNVTGLDASQNDDELQASTDAQPHILQIKGSEIKNIAFQRIRSQVTIDLVSSEEDRDFLVSR